MDSRQLLSFIARAHQHTYAAPKAIKEEFSVKSFLPRHKEYDFSEGDWGYHDSFAGHVWPPGKEIVFFKGEPVWCMSYQGKSLPADKSFIEQVYAFLR